MTFIDKTIQTREFFCKEWEIDKENFETTDFKTDK